MIIAAVEDLLFGSRIRAVAEGAGRPVTFVRRDGDLAAAVRDPAVGLVIVDLAQPGAAAAIREARTSGGASLPIVAFASHVRADLITEARAAGATRVLARSAFVAALPELVANAGGRPS